jgi:hypothetical protein
MNRDREESGFEETLDLLREAHREAIPEAHFAAVRARVLSQLATRRRPWWRVGWRYGFAAAALAAMLLAAFVGWTPGWISWSARAPLDPLLARRNQPHAIPERPTGASAADQGVRPTSAGTRPFHRRRTAAPAAYRVVAPPDPRPLVVKLITDDPNIVIYWIASIKGD